MLHLQTKNLWDIHQRFSRSGLYWKRTLTLLSYSSSRVDNKKPMSACPWLLGDCCQWVSSLIIILGFLLSLLDFVVARHRLSLKSQDALLLWKDMRKVCNSRISALDTHHAVGGNAWNNDTSRVGQKTDKWPLSESPKDKVKKKNSVRFYATSLFERSLWFLCIVYTKSTPLNSCK